MKVVIFSGGVGVRMGEATQRIPKPMIPIGSQPILWHIMKWYASWGHKEFILPWLGTPNVYVPVSDELVDEKLRLLREHHASQAGKHWFDDELFRGLAHIRCMESATRYAEAFTCRKLSLLPA